MKTFAVYGTVTGAQYLGEFEAESPYEATRKALDATGGIVILCHQCAHLCEDAEIHDLYAEEIH